MATMVGLRYGAPYRHKSNSNREHPIQIRCPALGEGGIFNSNRDVTFQGTSLEHARGDVDMSPGSQQYVVQHSFATEIEPSSLFANTAPLKYAFSAKGSKKNTCQLRCRILVRGPDSCGTGFSQRIELCLVFCHLAPFSLPTTCLQTGREYAPRRQETCICPPRRCVGNILGRRHLASRPFNVAMQLPCQDCWQRALKRISDMLSRADDKLPLNPGSIEDHAQELKTLTGHSLMTKSSATRGVKNPVI